jgi:hypothetical protein
MGTSSEGVVISTPAIFSSTALLVNAVAASGSGYYIIKVCEEKTSVLTFNVLICIYIEILRLALAV